MRRLRLAVIAGAAVSPVLSGCLVFAGDPPPAPNVAPIEVVAKADSCLLNRDSVAAGNHEVTVIMEEGSGWVRFVKDGKVLLDRPVRDQSSEVDQSELELQQGTYVVECEVDSQASTTELTVTP